MIVQACLKPSPVVCMYYVYVYVCMCVCMEMVSLIVQACLKPKAVVRTYVYVHTCSYADHVYIYIYTHTHKYIYTYRFAGHCAETTASILPYVPTCMHTYMARLTHHQTEHYRPHVAPCAYNSTHSAHSICSNEWSNSSA